METHCLSCRKYTINNNSMNGISKHNRLVLISNCTICGKKKSNIVKNQEASVLLSNSKTKDPLRKIIAWISIKVLG